MAVALKASQNPVDIMPQKSEIKLHQADESHERSREKGCIT